jgi:hypothetical protein
VRRLGEHCNRTAEVRGSNPLSSSDAYLEILQSSTRSKMAAFIKRAICRQIRFRHDA